MLVASESIAVLARVYVTARRWPASGGCGKCHEGWCLFCAEQEEVVGRLGAVTISGVGQEIVGVVAVHRDPGWRGASCGLPHPGHGALMAATESRNTCSESRRFTNRMRPTATAGSNCHMPWAANIRRPTRSGVGNSCSPRNVAGEIARPVSRAVITSTHRCFRGRSGLR